MASSPPRAASSNDLLARPLQFLKGVGPRKADLLKRLWLETVRDLLFFLPVAHKDRASVTPIARLRLGQDQNVRAKIVDMSADAMVVEVTGAEDKIRAFVDMVRPFGIQELVRTGRIAIARSAKNL